MSKCMSHCGSGRDGLCFFCLISHSNRLSQQGTSLLCTTNDAVIEL